jgi:hypothetical protein
MICKIVRRLFDWVNLSFANRPHPPAPSPNIGRRGELDIKRIRIIDVVCGVLPPGCFPDREAKVESKIP